MSGRRFGKQMESVCVWEQMVWAWRLCGWGGVVGMGNKSVCIYLFGMFLLCLVEKYTLI